MQQKRWHLLLLLWLLNLWQKRWHMPWHLLWLVTLCMLLRHLYTAKDLQACDERLAMLLGALEAQMRGLTGHLMKGCHLASSLTWLCC